MSEDDRKPPAAVWRGLLTGPRRAWTLGGGLVVIGLLGAMVLAGRHAAAPPAASSGPKLRGGQSVDIEKLEAATASLDAAAKAMKSKQGQVKTLSADALKAYLPASAVGYARGQITVESEEDNDLSGPTVRAHYAGKAGALDLSVSDLGAAGALAALAGAFNVESAPRTDGRIEKVGKVDGRMTAESWDPATGKGEYSVLVAERFMIHVEGQGMELKDIKSAADAVGLARLEAVAAQTASPR
jgi:hypothetical protein